MKIKTKKKLQIETRCDGRVLISLFVEKSCAFGQYFVNRKNLFQEVGKQRLEKKRPYRSENKSRLKFQHNYISSTREHKQCQLNPKYQKLKFPS